MVHLPEDQSGRSGAISHVGSDISCIQCGYNLRGLPASSACPECGRAVVESVSAVSGLRKRDIAFVVVRAVSFWIFVSGSIQAVSETAKVVKFFASHKALPPDTLWVYLNLIGAVTTVLASLVIWFKAGWLAKKIVVHDSFIVGIHLGRKDILQIVFSVFGLYLLVTGTEVLIKFFGHVRFTDRAYYEYLAPGIFRVMIGTLLLVGVYRILGFIRRLAGTN